MLALGQTKLALDEAVAGEEGEEEKVEQEIKTSLMNVVRRKLETVPEQESEPEPVPEPVPESEAGVTETEDNDRGRDEPMDVEDLGSPLSAIDEDEDL